MSDSLVIDGFQMHFEVHKGLAAQDVLFIHGNLASARWWQPTLAAWRRAAAPQAQPGALIFADWRGCGESSDPRDPAELRVQTLASDHLRLLEHLGVASADLVGHSTGGAIALAAMVLSPRSVRKAVLLDSVGAGGIRFGAEMKAAFRAMAADKALTAEIIGSTIRNNDPQSPFFKEVVVPDAFRAARALGTWVLDGLEGLDLAASLAALRQEVLVLHGEFDDLLPKADSQRLAALLPRGRYLELAGCGHCGNIEAPERFVRTAADFLNP